MNGFSLSSKNLMFIERLSTTETFTFRTNRSKYLLPRCIAVFLSEKVFSIVKSNATMNELALKTPDDKGIFEQIIQLGYGKQIVLTEENKHTVLAFAKELDNRELMDACMSFNATIPQSSLTLKNAISALKSKISIGVNVDDDIAFVAENFFSFDQKELYTLDSHTLKRILSKPALAERNENTLFNIIFDLVSQKGRNYFPLFEFINFEEIGFEEITRFVNAFNASSLSETIWRSIGRRLTNRSIGADDTDAPKTSVPRKKSGKKKLSHPLPPQTHEDITEDFPVTEDDAPEDTPKKGEKTEVFEVGENPFQGVLNSFPVLKGKVAISSSSKNTGFLSKIVNFDNNTNFWTHNEPDSWIRIDFKKMSLIPSAYSISGRCDHDYNQLQSWVLEALSGKTWVVIDEHIEQPLSTKVPVTYYLKDITQRYKSFRLRQTGPNTYGDYDLVLSRIELFGTLIKSA